MKTTRVLRWVILASVGTIVACGGVSDIGRGDEASNGMGSAGNGPGNGSGGAMAVGGGEPGTGARPGMGTGGAMAVGGGGPLLFNCTADYECGVDDVPCEMCADGSHVCPRAFCSEGRCRQVGGSCATQCESDMDCPVRDLACADCGDGSTSCPTTQCVMGQCQTSYPGCGNIDPCEGQGCGAPCTPCGPEGMCPPDYAAYCSADGKCVPGLPQCGMQPGGDSCETAMDCPSTPPVCVACGNDTCAGFECIQNKCVFACPANPTPQCMTVEDCGPFDAVCKMCPGGECAVPACLSGSCEMVCKL